MFIACAEHRTSITNIQIHASQKPHLLHVQLLSVTEFFQLYFIINQTLKAYTVKGQFTIGY